MNSNVFQAVTDAIDSAMRNAGVGVGRAKLLRPIISKWVMAHPDAGKKPDIMAASVTSALCEKMNQRGDKKLLITNKTSSEEIVAALNDVWAAREAESASYDKPVGVDPLRRLPSGSIRTTVHKR